MCYTTYSGILGITRHIPVIEVIINIISIYFIISSVDSANSHWTGFKV